MKHDFKSIIIAALCFIMLLLVLLLLVLPESVVGLPFDINLNLVFFAVLAAIVVPSLFIIIQKTKGLQNFIKFIDNIGTMLNEKVKTGNIAFAMVCVNGLMSKTAYVAYSSSKASDDSKAEVEKIFSDKGLSVTFCEDMNIIQEYAHLKRSMPDGTFATVRKGGYAERKIHCSERKILAYLFKHYDNDDLNSDIEIFLYTKMEPCSYCHNLIKDAREKFANVFEWYNEQTENLKSEAEEYFDSSNLTISEILEKIGNIKM